MRIYISSGNSVDEVCRALWHFHHWLLERYTFETITLEYAKCEDGYKSILLESDDERLCDLQGTHLWKVQSPFRPKHKRKNWYFSLHCYDEHTVEEFDQSKVIYQTMKSPKKGGQHVNTTCSGVRVLYPPLRLEAVSYDERSQHRNKQISLQRLVQKAEELSWKKIEDEKMTQWKEGKEIVRGNPVKTFQGEKFSEVKR